MKPAKSESQTEQEVQPVQSCQIGGGATSTKAGYEHIVATNEETK